MTFWGETEHFSGRIGALRWSILVGKQKHNVQKPNPGERGKKNPLDTAVTNLTSMQF